MVIPKLTWKGFGVGLVVLFLVLQAAFLVRGELLSLSPVQVLSHQVAPESPYVCFVAVQGGTRLLAMDCVDVTQTDADRLAELLGTDGQ